MEPQNPTLPPLLFCDVDGVLRARDRTRGTSGNAHDFNPTLHYSMDRSRQFDPERWTFHFSSEMIAEFRDLIEQEHVDFRWTTNWQEFAETLLNPLFEFPTHVRHIPINRRKDDEEQTFKYAGMVEHLQALGADQRPFVWVDDVAALPHLPGGSRANLIADTFDVPHLVIAPEERFGITRAQMQEIRTFLHDHNPTNLTT